MGSTDYAYAVSNVRANEYKLLKMDQLRQYVLASSLEDMLNDLKSYDYDFLTNRLSDYEIISGRTRQILTYLQTLSGGSNLFDIFLIRNDFHNVKLMIKGAIAKRETSSMEMLPCLYSSEKLKENIEKRAFSNLPEWIMKIAERAFIATTETKDGQVCDMIIDKGYLERIKRIAKQSKNRFMIEYIEKEILQANFKIALRGCKAKKREEFILSGMVACEAIDIKQLAHSAGKVESLKEYFISKGYQVAAEAIEGSITQFERYCEEVKLHHAEATKYQNFGIEPLISHFIYYEMQQKNLQVILAGKRVGLNDQEILERMYQGYA